MASFAKLDNNNIVLAVLSVSNEVIKDANGVEQELLGVQFLKSLYGQDTNWKQTSYNKNFRKNYAGIGMTYDETRDAFIPPKTIYNGQVCNSWILNEETLQWEAPTPMPTDGKPYTWDEETVSWVEITE